jgi:hypothetical protein
LINSSKQARHAPLLPFENSVGWHLVQGMV